MKCKIPEREPTEKEMAAMEKRNIKSNDRVFNYVSRLISISIRKNAGFGVKRFSRFNSNSYDIGQYYINRYGEGETDPEEYAVDSYYALRRDLRAIGWDAEKELWSDDIFDTFESMHGLSKKKRVELAGFIGYAKAISFYTREMICMSAMGLHEDFGFGAERLNVVMHPVRDRYLNLMRIFIHNKKNRAAYDAEMRAVLDEFNELKIFVKESEL